MGQLPLYFRSGMTNSYNKSFRKELEKLIQEQMSRIKDNLALGLSVDDFPAYKMHVGRISAYDDVLKMLDEIESLLSQR